jgi:hypothetical protein
MVKVLLKSRNVLINQYVASMICLKEVHHAFNYVFIISKMYQFLQEHDIQKKLHQINFLIKSDLALPNFKILEARICWEIPKIRREQAFLTIYISYKS